LSLGRKSVKLLPLLYVLLGVIYLALFCYVTIQISKPVPPEMQQYAVRAGPIILLVRTLLILDFAAALACLAVAFGVLRGWAWARTLGLIVSLPTVAILLPLEVFSVFERIRMWSSLQSSGFNPLDLLGTWTLVSIIIIVNSACIFYLWKLPRR